jgi:hypothetical protein
MIPWSAASAFERREREGLAHRRRLRERLNRTWDMLQAQQCGQFERGLARPPLAPNGHNMEEDATP